MMIGMLMRMKLFMAIAMTIIAMKILSMITMRIIIIVNTLGPLWLGAIRFSGEDDHDDEEECMNYKMKKVK
jgi:hypothetical protein